MTCPRCRQSRLGLLIPDARGWLYVAACPEGVPPGAICVPCYDAGRHLECVRIAPNALSGGLHCGDSGMRKDEAVRATVLAGEDERVKATCEACGGSFLRNRPWQRFCPNEKCRQRAWAQRKRKDAEHD